MSIIRLDMWEMQMAVIGCKADACFAESACTDDVLRIH